MTGEVVRRSVLWWGLLVVAALLPGLMFVRGTVGNQSGDSPAGVEHLAGGTLLVRTDFAWLFNCARVVWESPGIRPYTLEGQRYMVKTWLKTDLISQAPVAYAPTFFLWIYPFRNWPELVVLCLNLAGGLALMAVYLREERRGRSFAPSPSDWLFLCCWALAVFLIIRVGQFNLWFLGALGVTWHRLFDPSRGDWKKVSRVDQLLFFCLLIFLSPKPHYAAVLSFLLILSAQWQVVGMALLSVGLIFAGLSLQFTGSLIWIGDYLHFLGHYTPTGLPSWLGSHLPWKDNTNAFAALLAFGVKPDVIAKLSECVGLASAVGLYWGWRHRLPGRELLSAVVVLYLVFCPHMVAHENAAVVLLFSWGKNRERTWMDSSIEWISTLLLLSICLQVWGVDAADIWLLAPVLKWVLVGLILAQLRAAAGRSAKAQEAVSG